MKLRQTKIKKMSQQNRELYQSIRSLRPGIDGLRQSFTATVVDHPRTPIEKILVNDEEITAKRLFEFLEAGATDSTREGVERAREERTGTEWSEDGVISDDAAETIGDWIDANYEMSISLRPTLSPVYARMGVA